MSFGVHKYSSFLFDMYQEWNYWVLGNYIFGFSDRLPKTFARVATPISTLIMQSMKAQFAPHISQLILLLLSLAILFQEYLTVVLICI